MDRITYISAYRKNISSQEIEEIGRISQHNNSRDGLTGVLLCFRGLFYQILEGEAAPLYSCLDRIRKDPRHSDVVVLKKETNVEERRYGKWKMKTLILDEQKDPIVTPVRDLLDLMTRTYRTLEKYVPEEILEGIQQESDPLTWELTRDQNVVLFVDLIGFSTMIEKINLPELATLLEAFFGMTSQIIDSTGGRISKLLGDGFMAYYSIDQADQALKASVEIVKKLKDLRSLTPSPYLKYTYCGIGLSAGSLVKGNIGAFLKKDYTLLGDVVNSASRLETHTRKMGYAILFDHRFKDFLSNQQQSQIIKLGKFKPKGKVGKLTVYTLNDPDIIYDRSPKQIARAIRDIAT